MKKLILLFTLVLSLWACKNDQKTSGEDPRVEGTELDTTGVEAPAGEARDASVNTPKTFPTQLQSVFTAHGGLDHWKQMNNLCFEMKGKNGDEVHTISLPNRQNKIESKDWSIGNDANGVWLLRHDLGYEGNPVFYHNLMFYFYAMPFIISDPGTNYTAVEPTELDGEMYNGVKISYNDNVGDSPEDEYILYFDPTTNKMEWLAYTVTFKDQKKSDDWHYIKYDKWQEVNGLLLPEKLVWYNVENGKPKGKKMDIKFDKVTATETMLDASVFAKPDEAQYVK
ncbi:ELL-associated factor [Aequorivita sp. F47161]|uniref:ELL-associated factor n=1 Tax=Aequorivita vitellina TaxID=2874475 RepID=A0A9X1U8Y4_9FLAO|nr:ELL-associated factor [Aequorivita vitellina]MCG2417921.1 ELL-associated factor [Aequorivita vitellina]